MANSSSTILSLVGLNEKVLGDTVDVLLKDTNRLVNSNLAATAPAVDAVANGGSRKASLKFIKALPTDIVNIGNDDINDDGEVIGTGAGEYMAIRHDLNIGIGFTDLAAAVTRWDGKGGAPAMLADYWATIYDKIAASTINGALKVNTGLTYTGAAGVPVYDALMLAGATAGVHADEFDTLIVDPITYAQMRIDNKNGFVPASQTVSRFDEWAGFKLLKSKTFTGATIMARSGALAFGVGLPVPFIATEYERLGNKGNGQGADILHSRRSIVCQPQGFSYEGPIAPTVLKNGAVNPQLETAANWKMIVDDIEQIGFRKVVVTPKA